ncbi:MAG TPA: hypothetical protein VFH80_32425 [Solirubrobacteraceae bacterium]|nr:hypothetical protein [Solirubrobacteraceae bacterium]
MSFARAPGNEPPAADREIAERRGRPGAEVIALQRTIGNRAATRLLSRQVAPAQPQGFQAWVLRYRDADGNYTDDDGDIRWRRISLDEPEFVEDYVDSNILNATTLVTIDAGTYDTIEVYYKDGRHISLRREQIPNPNKRVRGPRVANITPFSEFEKHEDDGFIYPSFHGMVTFTDQVAPNLVSLRVQFDEIAEELARLRGLTNLAATFASIMAMYSGVVGSLHEVGEHPAAGLDITKPSRRRASPPPSSIEEPSSRPVGRNGETERETPMALPERPARTARPRARRGEPTAPSEIPEKPARKKSARPFNHKDPETGELSGQREPESAAARTARLQKFKARIANFERTVKPNEVKGAPPWGPGGRPGHAESDHGWTKQMQADLLNRPERVFSGLNDRGREVDVYYRADDVVITEAGKKTSVITAYGVSSPKNGNDPAKVGRWANNPRYVEIKGNNVVYPDKGQYEADAWPQ